MFLSAECSGYVCRTMCKGSERLLSCNAACREAYHARRSGRRTPTSTATGTSLLLRSARTGAEVTCRAAEALVLLQAEDGEQEDDDKEESMELVCRGGAVLHRLRIAGMKG